MISVAQEAACVRTTSASEVDLRFLVRKRTGPNSTPMALKTKESKDPGTRFSLLSYYRFCYSRLCCWDDNGDAKSNFGIWVRKFGIGQGSVSKEKEQRKMRKGELKYYQKKKKETFWLNGHFNSSGIRHENRWKRNFVSVFLFCNICQISNADLLHWLTSCFFTFECKKMNWIGIILV